jgi:hypothetical protein
MEASPRLSTTLPYHISFTLQRDDDDGDPRCCIILWNLWSDVFDPSNLVLLRHVTDADGGLAGLEKVDIEPDFAYPLGARGGVEVFRGSLPQWRELPPGGRRQVKLQEKLPARYHKILVAGERYELLWPGSEAVA